MKAQVLLKHGDLDSYQYMDVEKPSFTNNDNPKSVIIKINYCALNNTDIWTREGAYSSSDDDNSGWQPLNFPRIQGADICGRIEETNSSNLDQYMNKLVLVYPTIYPKNKANNNIYHDDIQSITHCQYLGSELDGGYAEYIKVPFENVFIVPETCTLTSRELACFPTAYMTAYHMIKRIPESFHCKSCLISGISGGVGIALYQLLSYLYRDTINIIGITSESKINTLNDFSITNLVSRNKKISEMKQDILSLNNHNEIDIVFDVVAGEYMELFIDIMKPNGSYVSSGAIGNRNVSIHWPTFYLKHLNLYGSMLATLDDFKELTDIIFENNIVPIVDSIYQLSDLKLAQQKFISKKFIGKIVLNCDNQ